VREVGHEARVREERSTLCVELPDRNGTGDSAFRASEMDVIVRVSMMVRGTPIDVRVREHSHFL